MSAIIPHDKLKILLQLADAVGGGDPSVQVTMGPGFAADIKLLKDAVKASESKPQEAVVDPVEYKKGVDAMAELMSKDVAELAAKEPNATLDGYTPLLIRGRRFMIAPQKNPARLSQIVGALFYALENPMIDAILTQLGSTLTSVKPDGTLEKQPLVPAGGAAQQPQCPEDHLGRNILIGEVQEWPGAMLALLDPAGRPTSLGAPTSRNEDGTLNIRLTGNSFMNRIPEDQVRWITTPEEALTVLETLAKPSGE